MYKFSKFMLFILKRYLYFLKGTHFYSLSIPDPVHDTKQYKKYCFTESKYEEVTEKFIVPAHADNRSYIKKNDLKKLLK